MTSEYDKDTLERLVRLEEHVAVRFKEFDKALKLSRKILNYRLKGMNEFQKRMDKLEGTFATKEKLDSLSKLVYIGIGIVLTVQFIIIALIGYWQ